MSASWWDLLAAAAAGGGAKGAFDYLRSRGRHKLDEREQLAESTACHLKRLDAEVRDVREELKQERALRVAAQEKALDAERRAQAAEAEVAALIAVNEAMRAELRLMRLALVGTEAEKIEALIELGKRAAHDHHAADARVAAALADVTARHRAVKS